MSVMRERIERNGYGKNINNYNSSSSHRTHTVWMNLHTMIYNSEATESTNKSSRKWDKEEQKEKQHFKCGIEEFFCN